MRLAISISVGVVLSLTAGVARAGELVDARQLAIQGRHAEAREVARRALLKRPNDPEVLQIVVATSCELGDRETASRALIRLAPDVQTAAARHCTRRGIVFDSVSLATTSDPRQPWRIGSWITLATTATSLITWVALAIRVNDLEREKEQLILARRREIHDIYSGESACDEAETRGDEALSGVCRSGKRSAMAANVMLGVGLATAVLGGYLYYRGYVKREHSTTRISVGPGGAALSVSF